MNLLTAFRNYISAEQLFGADDALFLAVSGGVDSVVMCHLCQEAGFNFSILHCNFRLRGADSDADEAFVQQLADTLKVPFLVKHFETKHFAETNKLSTQAAARELRYQWFNDIIVAATKPAYLLTAHHANDNIETVMMNFFKGTGINGLHGIPPVENTVCRNLRRPLLFATRESILEYAHTRNLTWREDASNDSNIYTRNYFRNELIPGIQKVFPEVENNLLDNIARFRDVHILYRQSINANLKKLIEQKGKEWHIPVLKLASLPAASTILYEFLKEYGFTSAQTAEAMKLLNSESGRYISSATHRLLRNRNWLILSALGVNDHSIYLLEQGQSSLAFNDQHLKMSELNPLGELTSAAHEAMIDADLITFPLIIRKWKQGDYFYPLGMDKKKKLSRFFIDQKLSLTQKENTWLIESDKKIVWVMGLRIDNRFRVTGSTKKIIKFSLSPSK